LKLDGTSASAATAAIYILLSIKTRIETCYDVHIGLSDCPDLYPTIH